MEGDTVKSEKPELIMEEDSLSEEKKSDDIPEIPVASPTALKFLESLVPERDFKYLMFDDKLVTVSDTGKELGEFCVTIEPTKHNGQDCFLVHANSHGAIDGVPCGTSITCYVTRQLETLEQHHHEYVNLENCPLDRKTNIIKQENEYTINRIITQGEAIERKNKSFTFEEMKGFISEGSNLLLHRLIIEKNMPDGDFQLVSFDSETCLCAAIYKGLEERTQTVEGTEFRVLGIERTINSKADLPTTWQSYFTQDGHLTNRVQVGSPVGMKLAKVPVPVIRDEEPPKPVFEKRNLDIEEDMQMFSKFLDRKIIASSCSDGTINRGPVCYRLCTLKIPQQLEIEKEQAYAAALAKFPSLHTAWHCLSSLAHKEDIKGDHATYMRHHPELKALLADFLQFLLLRKPNDVISFASEYFSAFSTKVPDASPYLASNAPSPFPVIQGNALIEQLRTPSQ